MIEFNSNGSIVTVKKYSKQQHNIDQKEIDPDALEVLHILHKNGFKAYLVGGSVRDLLLNYTPKDYDISTDALPEEVKKCFSNCFIVGKRFRLAHVRMGHKVYEVSTFRKGDNEDDTLIYSDNEWGSEEEDVTRRDFTVNGLFYDSKTEEIIDYVGGVEDAKKNLLRCIGNPYIRFKQDPVRMIRLLKFKARFDLTPDEEMIEALFVLRREILKSSPARILEEFLRMLESGSSVSFIKILQDHGFLETLLPNLAHFFETPIEKEIYDFLTDIDRSILVEQKKPQSRAILVSCLIYPIFKQHIFEMYESFPKKTHLGKIQDEAHDSTEFLFEPTLRITKKILAEVVNILSTQYRFTPLQKNKRPLYKIPKTQDFSSSLKFLKIRTNIEPGLTEIYTRWQDAYENHKKEHPKTKDFSKEKSTRRKRR